MGVAAMPGVNSSSDPNREVKELCFSGDWACADGNLDVLGYVAHRVAAYAAEPLHGQLLDLAEMCREYPDHAVAVWLHLKNQLLGQGRYLPS